MEYCKEFLQVCWRSRLTPRCLSVMLSKSPLNCLPLNQVVSKGIFSFDIQLFSAVYFNYSQPSNESMDNSTGFCLPRDYYLSSHEKEYSERKYHSHDKATLMEIARNWEEHYSS